MKKKWLSSLALALALLLLTGAASAQCQVTISYNKLTAVEGEAIRADYVIDGFEQDKVNLYWRVAMTDRTDVMDPNPKVNYDGVNYWEASVKPESATGSTAVRTVGAGFVQLVALRDSGVQDPGEIYEFDVCDTLAERVCFDPAERKAWKGESKEDGA